MIPQTSEQKGVAERVRQLGAGIKVDKKKGTAVLNTIKEIWDNENYKKIAVKIAEDFRKCTGAKGAAEKILKVCEEK